jgi:hypothetical protein
MTRETAARRCGLALGIYLLLLVTNPGRNEVLDAEMRREVSRAIWSQGTIALSHLPEQSAGTWIPVGHGRWVAPYGIGQSLVFLPFDALGALLERHSPGAWRQRIGWIPIGLGLLPLLGILWWYSFLALLDAWHVDAPTAEVAATALFLGTIGFFYAGQPQEECLVGALVGLSLAAALRARESSLARHAVLAGLYAGAALITRPVSVFALVAVGVTLLGVRGPLTLRVRALFPAAVAVAAVASIGLAYNHARFGSALTSGYDRLGHFGLTSWDLRSLGILAILLVGPGIGLLVLSPILLIGVAAIRSVWRRDRTLAVAILAGTAACLAFFSGWHDSYTGGTAWGTRYQAHLVTLWAVPVAIGLKRWMHRRVVIAIVAVSLVLQLASVLVTHHLEPYEAECAAVPQLALLVGARDGQLGRRLETIARWSVGAPRRPSSAACEPALQKMWDRYIPNFWAVVYARRMPATWGVPLVAIWSVLVVAGSSLTVRGLKASALASRQSALDPSGYLEPSRRASM